MLRALIRFSLNYSSLILLGSLLVLGYAAFRLPQTSIDVFPEINSPTVTIMAEASGLAADEVEQYVTFPIETAVNGMTGVRRVRSSSLNGFRPIDDLEQLLASEGEVEGRSRRALHEEKRFFPGFFTALLERLLGLGVLGLGVLGESGGGRQAGPQEQPAGRDEGDGAFHQSAPGIRAESTVQRGRDRLQEHLDGRPGALERRDLRVPQ